jgi:hypothetical protein
MKYSSFVMTIEKNGNYSAIGTTMLQTSNKA